MRGDVILTKTTKMEKLQDSMYNQMEIGEMRRV